MDSDKCVIMVGNLDSGFRVVGPFDSFDEAAAHDDEHYGGANWIATLYTPTRVIKTRRVSRVGKK